MKLFQNVLILLAGMIGAGIATGREVYQYFFASSVFCVIFLIFYAVLFGFFLQKLERIKQKKKIYSFESLNKLLFNKKNNIFSFCYYISAIIICMAMLSASRELFSNIYISYFLPLFLIVFSTIVCYYGINIIKKISFPISLFLIIAVLINTLLATQLDIQNTMSKDFSILSFLMPLLFFTGNIILLISIILKDKKIIKNHKIYFLLPLIFVVLILMILYSLSHISNLENEMLPLLTLSKNNGTFFGAIYLIAILFAIITTLCIVQHSVFMKINNKKYNGLYLGLLIFLLSFLSFDVIVQFAYSFIGIIGFVYIALIFVIKIE